MSTESDAKAAPVYVPYATFVSALDNLRTHGIPGTGKIDKSLWDSQSGAIQGQLILGFRFLGLIDDKNNVLGPLTPLVEASPDDRKRLLRPIIEEKYRRVVSLNLDTISQGQLDEAFRAYGVNGSTLIRAVRFFVKACSEVGIPISKRVAGKTRISGVTRKRTKNGTSPLKRVFDENSELEDRVGHQSAQTWEGKLLEKFPTFDPAWPDELKSKWFEGFGRLMNAKNSE